MSENEHDDELENREPEEDLLDVDPADVTIILPDDGDFADELAADCGLISELPASDTGAVGASADDPDATAFIGDPDVTEEVGSLVSLIGDMPDFVGDPGNTEEMFVVLPDGDEDIPVVDTEEVTEATSDVELRQELASSADASPVDVESEETEIDMDFDGEDADATSLEDVTADLDDELLTEDTESLTSFDLDGDDEDALTSEDDLSDEEDGFDSEDGSVSYEAEDGEFDDDEFDAAPSGGGIKKILIPLAAAALIGTGLLFFNPFGGEPVGGVSASSGQPAAGAVVDPAAGDPMLPEAGGDAPSDDPTASSLAVASREVFSEKLALALDLGFGGRTNE